MEQDFFLWAIGRPRSDISKDITANHVTHERLPLLNGICRNLMYQISTAVFTCRCVLDLFIKWQQVQENTAGSTRLNLDDVKASK